MFQPCLPGHQTSDWESGIGCRQPESRERGNGAGDATKKYYATWAAAARNEWIAVVLVATAVN